MHRRSVRIAGGSTEPPALVAQLAHPAGAGLAAAIQLRVGSLGKPGPVEPLKIDAAPDLKAAGVLLEERDGIVKSLPGRSDHDEGPLDADLVHCAHPLVHLSGR